MSEATTTTNVVAVEDLLIAAGNVKSAMEEGKFADLEDENDFISHMGLTFSARDEESSQDIYDEHARKVLAKADDYRKAQSRLSNLGIFGPKDRSKKKGSFITASALITKEALELGDDVTETDLAPLYGGSVNNGYADDDEEEDVGNDETKPTLYQVPSVYYMQPHADAAVANHERWRYIYGPDSARITLGNGHSYVPVCLVALTHLEVHFVPHTSEHFLAWEFLTVKGKHIPDRKDPLTSTTLTTPFCTMLHTDRDNHTLKCTMRPGDRIITHRGMPLWITSVDPASVEDRDEFYGENNEPYTGPYLAKTVCAEKRPPKADMDPKGRFAKRYMDWRRALSQGGWHDTTFDTNVSHNAIHRPTKKPEPLFPAVSYADIKGVDAIITLVKSPSGAMPADPEIKKKRAADRKAKAAAAAAAAAEEEDEDDGRAKPMDIDQEEPKRKEEEEEEELAGSPSKQKEKKSNGSLMARKRSAKAKSKSKSPQKAKPTPKKKKKVARISPAVELFDQHDALDERISKLDRAAWNPVFSNVAKKHRAALEKDTTTPEAKQFIKKYRTSLKTLTGKVDTAEEDQKELLGVITGQMTKAKAILGALECPTDNKKIKGSFKSRTKELAELTGAYLMRSAKKVETFLEDCQKLQKAVEEDANRKRKRAEEAEARAKARAEAAPAGAMVVPAVADEDELEPMMCWSGLEIQNVFAVWNDRVGAFRNMVMRHDTNAELNALFEAFEEAKDEIATYMQDYYAEHQNLSGASFDVSKLEAHGNALQHVFDTYGSGKPIAGNKKHKKGGRTMVVCHACGHKVPEFSGTGYCKPCFRAHGLREILDGLERRAKKLDKLAVEETDAALKTWEAERAAAEENGEDPSEVCDEPPIGEYQTAWDTWDGVPKASSDRGGGSGDEAMEGSGEEVDDADKGLFHRLTTQAEIFDQNERANNWETLSALIQEAHALLPVISPDEDEDYDSADADDDDDEDADAWIVHSDDEEEEEAHFSSERPSPVKVTRPAKKETPQKKKNDAKRKREESAAVRNGLVDTRQAVVEKEESGLAHDTLCALKRYKSPKMHTRLLELYPDQPGVLRAELERVSNIKHVYVIDMHWEGAEDDVATHEHHFANMSDAMAQIQKMTMQGLILKARKTTLE